MCYERSWFTSQEKAKAEEKKPDSSEKRSQTVDALLRESNEQAQKAKAEPEPAKEAAPAK